MNQFRTTAVWTLLLVPLTALAQTVVRSDPADPRLGAPAPVTESAFAGYRSYRDEPLAPWREVNDDVRELGGHAGHIRDVATPTERVVPREGDRPPAKPAAPATTGGKHAH